MQINLINTNETLELETSTNSLIHYKIGYIDITSSNISNPLVNRGTVNTITTTTILSAPASSTTRKVQYINIYNAGTSTNVLKIKEDVGGVENISMSITLQVHETLRIVNDKVEVLDASGRVKLQNQGDTEIAGDSRVIFKVGTAAEAAGQYYCFAKDNGAPGAWVNGSPGINGRNTNGTLAADAGCINAGTPISGSNYIRDISIAASQTGMFILADVLWVNSGLVVTTTTAQSITQPTLPARDNLGTSNGYGIGAGLLVTTTTTNAGIITNMTLQYTNSNGVAGRTGTISFPATAVIGTFVPFQLAQGDVGIRSIQSITFGTSLAGGAVSLLCFNFLATAPVVLANVGSIAFQRKLDLKLNNEHCLLPFWLASTTTATNLSGTIYFINK